MMKVLSLLQYRRWVLLGLLLGSSAMASAMDLSALGNITGLAPAYHSSAQLVIATHDGLYGIIKAGPDRIGDNVLKISALDSTSKGIYYVSGHPVQGKDAGLLISDDGGKHWSSLSKDNKESKANQKRIDFRSITISRVNPDWIYAISNGLWVSRNAGKHWEETGTLPDKTFSIAASGIAPDILYAGTNTGLMISRDRGKTWKLFADIKEPVTAIYIDHADKMTIFGISKGVMSFPEKHPTQKTAYNGFGVRYLRFITKSNGKWWGVDQMDTLWVEHSPKNWTPFRLPVINSPEALQGEKLFNQNCAGCHGTYGVGESYSQASMTQHKYQMAPALDWSMHAWHHTDKDIAIVIQNGIKSIKNSRMPAWHGILNNQQTQDIIRYIKSLWRPKELSCQGPKHMTPQCRTR